jgi:hypothetical protein
MSNLRKGGRPMAAAIVACLLVPAAAPAQELPQSLRAPTIAASIASAADWASTYHALKNFRVREANPLLRPLDRTPGRLITMGAVIDVASFSAWNLTVGRNHPKVAAAGLWGAAAFRAYLAIHNLRNTRIAERRRPN